MGSVKKTVVGFVHVRSVSGIGCVGGFDIRVRVANKLGECERNLPSSLLGEVWPLSMGTTAPPPPLERGDGPLSFRRLVTHPPEGPRRARNPCVIGIPVGAIACSSLTVSREGARAAEYCGVNKGGGGKMLGEGIIEAIGEQAEVMSVG